MGDDGAFKPIDWETSSNRASGRDQARIEQREEARRMITQEVKRHQAVVGARGDSPIRQEMAAMAGIEAAVHEHTGDATEEDAGTDVE